MEHWRNNNQQEKSEARWFSVCVRAMLLKLRVMIPLGTAQSITLEKRKGQAIICTSDKGLTPPFYFTVVIVICSSTFFTTWLLALWTDWKESWKSQAERQLWNAWDACLPVLPFRHCVLVSELVSEHGAGVQQLALVISLLESVSSITLAFAFLHVQFPHPDRCFLEYFPAVGGILGEGIHLYCHDPKWAHPTLQTMLSKPRASSPLQIKRSIFRRPRVIGEMKVKFASYAPSCHSRMLFQILFWPPQIVYIGVTKRILRLLELILKIPVFPFIALSHSLLCSALLQHMFI